MSERQVTTTQVTLDDEEYALQNTAIAALQVVFRAEVVAIVYRDERGLALTPRPGEEVRILTDLSLADWSSMISSVEEV